jgi:hypothetical protein
MRRTTFEHKAHPPLRITAPLIVALVRQRRQKLRHQISMRTMDLHTIEARRLTPPPRPRNAQ